MVDYFLLPLAVAAVAVADPTTLELLLAVELH
jgi:hypothetical protein